MTGAPCLPPSGSQWSTEPWLLHIITPKTISIFLSFREGITGQFFFSDLSNHQWLPKRCFLIEKTPGNKNHSVNRSRSLLFDGKSFSWHHLDLRFRPWCLEKNPKKSSPNGGAFNGDLYPMGSQSVKKNTHTKKKTNPSFAFHIKQRFISLTNITPLLLKPTKAHSPRPSPKVPMVFQTPRDHWWSLRWWDHKSLTWDATDDMPWNTGWLMTGSLFP